MHEPSSGFTRLLGSMSRSEFVEQYLFKLPYAGAGACLDWCDFGWADVEQIWSQPQVDAMVVRRGQRLEKLELPAYEAARQMFGDGYTLAVRSAQKHHVRLAAIAEDFQQVFLAPIDIHVYCTPADQFGFSWHFDAEEVFILQTKGAKEYSLRKNTVHPWPLVETMGADLGYQHEIMPLMKCNLAAGDWLYIPAGYWHRGESTGESISLAIGVMAPPALDVFDALRSRLLRSLRWRQRLPVPKQENGLPTDSHQVYAGLLSELGNDLQRELTSQAFLDEYLASREVCKPEQSLGESSAGHSQLPGNTDEGAFSPAGTAITG